MTDIRRPDGTNGADAGQADLDEAIRIYRERFGIYRETFGTAISEITEQDLAALRDIYIEVELFRHPDVAASQRSSLFNPADFSLRLLKTVEKFTNPIGVGWLKRSFEDGLITVDETNIALMTRLSNFASKLMQRAAAEAPEDAGRTLDYARRVLMAASDVTRARYPYYHSHPARWLSELLESPDPERNETGRKLIFSIPWGLKLHYNDVQFVSWIIASYFDEPKFDLAQWVDQVRSFLKDIEPPPFDPKDMDAYVGIAWNQLRGFVFKLVRSVPEIARVDDDHEEPVYRSLRVLMDRGETELAHELMSAFLRLGFNRAQTTIALIHVAASQEELTPERIKLINSVANLIEFAVHPTNVKMRYKIVPLALAYLARTAPDPQLDKDLAKHLDEFVEPEDELDEVEFVHDGSFIWRTWSDGKEITHNEEEDDQDGGPTPRHLIDISHELHEAPLLYDFLNDLVHHSDPSSSNAAKLLQYGYSFAHFSSINFVNLFRLALREDMLRGTEAFDQERYEIYVGAAMNEVIDSGISKEVHDLVMKSEISLDGPNEEFLSKYRELIRTRKERGGKDSGSGGASGPSSAGSPSGIPPAPETPPSPATPPPAGDSGAASASAAEISDADYEYVITDADAQITAAGDYDYEIDVDEDAAEFEGGWDQDIDATADDAWAWGAAVYTETAPSAAVF